MIPSERKMLATANVLAYNLVKKFEWTLSGSLIQVGNLLFSVSLFWISSMEKRS